MPAMVDQLLFIKEFREQKAETELQKSRVQLTEAHRVEDEAARTRDEFVDFARREELRWYDDLCSRLVTVRDITHVQEDVATLRVTERDHETAVERAAARRAEAQTQFSTATQVRRDAQAAREKFVELATSFHALAAREAERREELELEELAGQRREREEWGEAVDE